MSQLQGLRIFRCIVEACGFSAAAERLGTTHSTVSRQLRQLEAGLGVQLINRTTRTLTLTRAGEIWYAACVEVLDRMEEARQTIAGEQTHVAGRLRVSLPLAIGALEAADWLPGFQQRYPDVELDMSCSDRLVDLVGEGFDVAIRISAALADTSLVSRTLAVSDMVLVAAPGYVARHGLPAGTTDLAGHRFVAYSGGRGPVRWTLAGGGADEDFELPAQLRVDTIAAAYAATLAGCGIASFTRHTVRSALVSGQMLHILPGVTTGTWRYTALYPQTRHVAPKVRAFVDHMARHYRGA